MRRMLPPALAAVMCIGPAFAASGPDFPSTPLMVESAIATAGTASGVFVTAFTASAVTDCNGFAISNNTATAETFTVAVFQGAAANPSFEVPVSVPAYTVGGFLGNVAGTTPGLPLDNNQNQYIRFAAGDIVKWSYGSAASGNFGLQVVCVTGY